MSHTPGPWRCSIDMDHGGTFDVGHQPSDAIGWWGLPLSDDNARLIAAAPELLDALNGMIGLIQLIESREPELKKNHRFIEAEAVVAKAEGR